MYFFYPINSDLNEIVIAYAADSYTYCLLLYNKATKLVHGTYTRCIEVANGTDVGAIIPSQYCPPRDYQYQAIGASGSGAACIVASVKTNGHIQLNNKFVNAPIAGAVQIMYSLE